MAAIINPAPTPTSGFLTITGATGVATLIFDGKGANGSIEIWDFYVQNLDTTAANAAFIGFTAATDVANGWSIPGGAAGGISPNEWIKLNDLPANSKVYANCANAATRDLRFMAIPKP